MANFHYLHNILEPNIYIESIDTIVIPINLYLATLQLNR